MKYTRRKRFVELENINEKEISMKKDLFEGTEQTQKVVAKAKKHKVLKKALVTLGLISAIGACVFLTACNKKGNDKTTNGVTPPTTQQGEQTGGNQGGNQGSQENQGGNQGGQTGGEQTGGNQGGETGGETNPEKPADKTPAEYKAECEEKLVQAVSSALQTKYKRSGKISNVELVKMNLENGKIYARAVHTQDGLSSDCFYGLESNLGNISNNSYKEISNKCDSISLSNIERSFRINSLISEEKYNALCNYVLGEYDLQDGEVLNVTKFESDGHDLQESIVTVLYNSEIFTLKAKTSTPSYNDNATAIDCLIGDNGLTKSVTITSRSAFKDFDNIVSAEAGISSYKVKLGGKTLFSKTNGNIVYNNDLGMGM